MIKEKSLEQLENNVWREPIEFESNLVRHCYQYRKIPLQDLTIEQLRLLISQKVGIDHLIKIAIEKLKENILAEGDFYPGDLLNAVIQLPPTFLKRHPKLLQELKQVIAESAEILKTELGEKDYERMRISN